MTLDHAAPLGEHQNDGVLADGTVRPDLRETEDMAQPSGEQSENQEVQRELVERARSLPGVASLLDVYGRLTAYTGVMVNVQHSQVRNATGGNAR